MGGRFSLLLLARTKGKTFILFFFFLADGVDVRERPARGWTKKQLELWLLFYQCRSVLSFLGAES